MIFAVQASTQTPDVKKQIEAQSRELSSRPSKWIKSPEEDIRQLVWLVIFCSETYKFPLAECRPIQINSPKCRRTPEATVCMPLRHSQGSTNNPRFPTQMLLVAVHWTFEAIGFWQVINRGIERPFMIRFPSQPQTCSN
jgi:hypothetical protein